MNCPPHIFYKKSYYSNTDYLIKRNCSQCSKCNKCLYYTYTYLTKITNTKFQTSTNYEIQMIKKCLGH